MFKKWLPVMVVLGALPAGAATTYAGGDVISYTNAINLLPGTNVNSGWVNFNGETSGTTITDVGPTGVDFAGFYGANPATLSVDLFPSYLSITATSGTTTTIQISFAEATYAAAFNLAVGNTSINRTWNYSVAGGGSGTVSVTPFDTAVFFGVVSDTAMTSMTFSFTSATDRTMFIQDFSVLTQTTSGGGPGGGSETPEPASMALMGAALTAIPLLARLRRRK